MSSRSGATLGKRLLGIALIDAGTGEAPGFGAAMGRTWGYLLSALPLNIGFFWAFGQSDSRAWHDLLAGTCVIETREKGEMARFGAAALSFLAFIFIALPLVWFFLTGPKLYELQKVADAQMVLDSLAVRQEEHKKLHGKYADDLEDLAGIAGSRTEFFDRRNELLDIKAGFEMEIDDYSYRIAAHARDNKSTKIEVSGPQRRGSSYFPEKK